VRSVSFQVCSGEVVGFAGLVGSGRTETMRMIFGVDKKRSGSLYKNGKEIRILSPKDAIANRMGFVTEDRKGEGLLLPLPCRYNTTIVALQKIKKYGILNMAKEKEIANQYKQSLRIVTPSMGQRVVQLSGGNQQKVVLSKWLFSDADIIIMDEPTRGVDVGAKREIYEIINQLAADGKAVIVVSSEMEEVMGISDRIYIMREGSIAGEVAKEDFSQEAISKYAIGGFES
jgi:ABC-type sugar transport system ATPase subunit